MSDAILEVECRLKDYISGELDKINAKLEQTKNKAGTGSGGAGASVLQLAGAFGIATTATGILTSVTGKIVNTINESIDAYLEDERSVKLLESAILRTGKSIEKVMPQMEEYTKNIFENTRFTDEDARAVEAQAMAYGYSGKKINDLLKISADLASARGMSLQEASNLIIRSVEGEQKTIKGLGLQLEGAAGSMEKFNSAQKALGIYAGRASADAKTMSGQIDMMNKRIEEEKERLGEATVGWKLFSLEIQNAFWTLGKQAEVDVLGKRIELMNGYIKNWESDQKAMFASGDVTTDFYTKKLIFKTDTIQKKYEQLSKAIKKSQEDIKSGFKFGKEEGGKESTVEPKPVKTGGLGEYGSKEYIEEQKAVNKLINDNELFYHNLKMQWAEDENNIKKENHKNELERKKAEKELAMNNMMGTLTTMRQIADMFKDKSKEGFEIAKAAAIAESTISAFQSINATLKIGGFWSIPLAIATGAFAMAQVANIASQSYAVGTRYAPGGMAMIHADEMMNVPAGSQIYSANETKNINNSHTTNNNQQNPVIIINKQDLTFKDLRKALRSRNIDNRELESLLKGQLV
jgi:hypothetical protein